MARKEYFALKMADGAKVRDIYELKKHFDLESVVKYFSEGLLLTWLTDRYYDEEADAIKKFSADDRDLKRKLCTIFEVDAGEAARRAERLAQLKKFTDDEKILACVDRVAFNQEDLADLLDEGVHEIFLCANRFVIPLRLRDKLYIGVGEPVAVIRSKEVVDFTARKITFKNISFDAAYQKVLGTASAAPKVELPTPLPPNVEIYGNTGKAVVKYSGRCGMERSVQTAKTFQAEIYFGARGESADAKNLSQVMRLNWKRDTQFSIIAYGSDAGRAVITLAKLIGG